jgi:hypothetical protein
MRDVAMIRGAFRRRLSSALSYEARLLHDMKIGKTGSPRFTVAIPH